MAEPKGITDSNDGTIGGDWYLVQEAECVDSDSELEDLESLFEKSGSGEELETDLDEPDQGNSAALHNLLLLQDNNKDVLALKRKYLSPDCVKDLSPQLELVTISPRHGSSKRRLFDSLKNKDETAHNDAATLQTKKVSQSSLSSSNSSNSGSDLTEELLKSKNRKACALAAFKFTFGVSLTDLTRNFINNKTCSHNWVVLVLGANEDLIEKAKPFIERQCSYLQLIARYSEKGYLALYLLEFLTSKCRDTVQNMICTTLNVNDWQTILEPPKIRSMVSALYFYKKSFGGGSYVYGQYPDWLVKLTTVQHQTATETFELCQMIQYAYDNDLTDECEIAYRYAQYAEENSNAAAWLKTNNQAKYVRDCARMVQLYKQQEMRNMTMSEYITFHCRKAASGGDWKTVMKLLRYQDVNGVHFLTCLKDLLSGKAKKHCMVIYGPPDTGKSHFCFSLISFLKGRVVTFVNSKSHFWLMPLANAKIALLDDATEVCWNYIDNYMRTGLDGNSVSVDVKYKAPMQLVLPPLLITTNVPIPTMDKYSYLKNRTMCFEFPKKCLFDETGNPVFNLTDSTWKDFFLHLAPQLGLELNLEEDGENSTSFRCMPRPHADAD
ncbi:E1 early protein [Bos taurus papillomavirus 27]|nr:E1 early protein [Bos taurus papillomavirus 27]QYI89673.1 E1 early protein [Bos taurus papillomavirus 27]